MFAGIKSSEFFSKYWQKKPVLLRKAYTKANGLLQPHDLFALASHETVESRIVVRDEKAHSWRLALGPFSARDMKVLPAHQPWTLLVQDVDKKLPRVCDLLEDFRSIPHWRIDDIMVSYARKNASVGPHIDHYDVFLIQTAGRRNWQIFDKKIKNPELLENCDLRILKNFKTNKNWILEAGDVLYLPPGIPHHGISLDDQCMTFSVGFRAPELKRMMGDFAEFVVNNLPEDVFYTDPHLKAAKWAGELNGAALKTIAGLIEKNIPSKKIIQRWISHYLSEPKIPLEWDKGATISSQDLKKKLMAGGILRRHEATRILYAAEGSELNLFINGTRYALKKSQKKFAALISSQRQVDLQDLQRIGCGVPELKLLSSLMSAGYFRFVKE